MTNKAERGQENELSSTEIKIHSQRLFDNFYGSLIKIPAGRSAIEEVEYTGRLSAFSFYHGPYRFEGEINLVEKQIFLSKWYPDYIEGVGEVDEVLRCEIGKE